MTNEMITLDVTGSDFSYPIHIGGGLLEHSLLKDSIDAYQIMIVTNQTVGQYYLPGLQKMYHDYQCNCCILPDGEQYKSLDVWQNILDALVSKQHHRDTTLVALGGGVVGDMTGFAAACYQRGVPFIQIPTTLLAQVDASVGGKTGINYATLKNLVGAFYQPKAVFIDLNTLHTLPSREYVAGVAEMIKAALIQDAGFLTDIETQLPSILKKDLVVMQQMIKRACEIKRDIVIHDEKEKGQRAWLNLGHTFAHAIEQLLGFNQLLHGEAVSIGLLMAAKLSYKKNLINHMTVKRIQHLLEAASLPTMLPKQINRRSIIAQMSMDKKVLNKTLRFVLLDRIGHAVIRHDVSESELMDVLQDNS